MKILLVSSHHGISCSQVFKISCYLVSWLVQWLPFLLLCEHCPLHHPLLVPSCKLPWPCHCGMWWPHFIVVTALNIGFATRNNVLFHLDVSLIRVLCMAFMMTVHTTSKQESWQGYLWKTHSSWCVWWVLLTKIAASHHQCIQVKVFLHIKFQILYLEVQLKQLYGCALVCKYLGLVKWECFEF